MRSNHLYRTFTALTCFLAMMIMVPLGGCGVAKIGSLSGNIIVDNQTYAVTINLTKIEFVLDPNGASFTVTLTNASGNSIEFLLKPKNNQGATLGVRFPAGTYTIGAAGNTFAATLAYTGGTTADFTGSGGSITFKSLTFGKDTTTGGDAVLLIDATFDVDLTDAGSISGSFTKDFSA